MAHFKEKRDDFKGSEPGPLYSIYTQNYFNHAMCSKKDICNKVSM